jgi:protein-S-isoprenylcysteine O-methyltransferase Ste14
MVAGGPFRWSRHPLNALGLPLLWLSPRMTENGLAFGLVVTGYLYLGSLHEESRLRAAYGEAYEAYRNSGPAFFLPSPGALLRLQPPRKSVPARTRQSAV